MTLAGVGEYNEFERDKGIEAVEIPLRKAASCVSGDTKALDMG
jgi:hypothetical protein